jgi:hypothetical protein
MLLPIHVFFFFVKFPYLQLVICMSQYREEYMEGAPGVYYFSQSLVAILISYKIKSIGHTEK